MNPEVFTPKYSLKFYLINIIVLIFGVLFLAGIWTLEILAGKIMLALLGLLCVSLATFLLFGSISEVQLASNGILVKRRWRTDQSFRYDQLSALDRDKISFVDKTKNSIGDALAIPLIQMANGDELIELFQKGMNEGRIPAFTVESRPEANIRVKKETRARVSEYASGRIRVRTGGLVLGGLLFLLTFLIRRLFGVEVNIWLVALSVVLVYFFLFVVKSVRAAVVSFGVVILLTFIIRWLIGLEGNVEVNIWVALLAVLLILVFLFGMYVAEGEDLKIRVRAGLAFLTYAIVWIGGSTIFFVPLRMSLGPDILSLGPAVPLFFVLLAAMGGGYIVDKVDPWIKKLPWMQ